MHARKYACQETGKHTKEKVKDKETKGMREGKEEKACERRKVGGKMRTQVKDLTWDREEECKQFAFGSI